MPDKLLPPFVIGSTNEAFWIEDSAGRRFGYVYYREQRLAGTGEKRLSKALALRTVKWIARMATEAAKG